jgi:hypothetical protein
MGIQEKMEEMAESKRRKAFEKENRIRARHVADIERVLAKAGIRKPLISDFPECREEYFKEAQLYNKQVGRLLGEVMKKTKESE